MKMKLGWLLSISIICLLGCETELTSLENSSSEHHAMEFTSAAFQHDVLDSSQVVLVDCWAPS